MKTFLEILEEHIQTDEVLNANRHEGFSSDFYSGTQEAGCLKDLLNFKLKSKIYKPKYVYTTSAPSLSQPTTGLNYDLSESQIQALDFMNHYLSFHERLAGPFTLFRLKKSYRLLAKKLHPDQGGSSAGFRELNTQYKILLDFLISIK